MVAKNDHIRHSPPGLFPKGLALQAGPGIVTDIVMDIGVTKVRRENCQCKWHCTALSVSTRVGYMTAMTGQTLAFGLLRLNAFQ